MVKAIIFDLDGVLIDLKETHFECLNKALGEIDRDLTITLDEHYKTFDGLPTKDKLKILTDQKGLNEIHYNEIKRLKQLYTIEYILKNVERNEVLIELMKELKEAGYILSISSNSVRNTIFSAAVMQGYVGYIDLVMSNQDVNHSKPNPEIYLTTISRLGFKPEECLIVEDSPFGIEAARKSGGYVMKVKNSTEVTLNNILNNIKLIEMKETNNKWDGKNWKILVPMAGAGSRFAQAGYTFPKPLIEVNGKPMIQVVVENLNIDAEFIYIVQKEHYDKFSLNYLLKLLTPNCKIVTVDHLTEGAACTTLLAKEYIDNDSHLLIANSDQFMEWDSNRFYYSMEDSGVDGGILTFYNTHPKWSYVKLDEEGYLTELAEKKPISTDATVGVYYWSCGSDYVKYAEQMISKDIRVNNEFYVAPVYNEAVLDDKKIKIHPIDKMWGLGTPEDLNYFIEQYNK
jgi:HAD superfamily hydrolase (TIGR01509 family)